VGRINLHEEGFALKSTYLIIGGGMTADAAARGIREVDPDGSITLISEETDPPYKRPPLSKDLWKGKSLDRIWSGTERRGVELHLGRTATALDLRAKRVVDDQGDDYHFEKLLLATGSRPRRLPFAGDRIIAFRTLADYRQLRDLAADKERFAVIGGGFIGSEIAAALALSGKQVTVLFPEPAIGSRLFPADLALSLNDLYRAHQVEVLTETTIAGVQETGDAATLHLVDQTTGQTRELTVDGIVAGIGTEPNVALAESAGLAVSGGIVVDEFLRTNHPDVYAAGDVAAFWQPALGLRRRVEHEDNAKTMGRYAGRAMAGEPAAYTHLPFFYSDLFDLGYEAVGEIDARMDTIADWTIPYQEGVIYYGRNGRVRGALLWNVWDQVDNARSLISDGAPLVPNALRHELPAPVSSAPVR
jgi:NADPH-dependent 2,4-dienoyl-CoA reductase/sulfur reductase-like enzyme